MVSTKQYVVVNLGSESYDVLLLPHRVAMITLDHKNLAVIGYCNCVTAATRVNHKKESFSYHQYYVCLEHQSQNNYCTRNARLDPTRTKPSDINER